MEYDEIIANKKIPRIIVCCPIISDEERKQRCKEINSEISGIFWANERIKAHRQKERDY